MTVKRTGITMCLAAVLSLPVTALADHGQGGSDGGSASSDPSGDNHGQNGSSSDDHGGPANPGGGNQPGGDHGGSGIAGHDDNGAAANPNSQFQRNGVSLAATTAGATIGASGHADIRVQGNEQRLSVEVEANVPDGTVFSLTANSTPIGVITMHLGEGEFEFESDNGQTLAGLMPAAITTIVVSDSANAAILQAQFGAISTQNPPLAPVLAVRKDLRFTATAACVTVRAEGEADLRSQGADTQLKVEVEAQVPDGTVWTILANNTMKLGTVTLHLMEGELRLGTADLLQAGLSDASAI